MIEKPLLVGIVPTVRLFLNEDPYEDRYLFVNNYAKKIYEAGAVPIGLLLENGQVNDEALKICDAFLWPGGSKIEKELYKVLLHAYKHRKPFLGICMGMQAMAVFSVMLEECQKLHKEYEKLTPEELSVIYEQMKKENPTLTILENPNIHGSLTVNRENISEAMHKIFIQKNSFLYENYQDVQTNVVSLHNVVVKRVGTLFDVTALSEDKIIEGIEAKDSSLNWLGVQYHPEITDDKLVKKWLNRKKEF